MLQWLWEDSRDTAVKWLSLKRNNCIFRESEFAGWNIALHTSHAAYGEYSSQTLFNWEKKDCIAHAWMTTSAVLWTVCGQSASAEARAMQEDSFSPFLITPKSERILPPRAQPWYQLMNVILCMQHLYKPMLSRDPALGGSTSLI